MPKMEVRLQYSKQCFDSRGVGIDLEELEIETKTVSGKKVEYVITNELETRKDYHLTVHFESNTKDKTFTCLMLAPPGQVLRFYDLTQRFEERAISWKTLPNKTRRLVLKRFYLEEK